GRFLSGLGSSRYAAPFSQLPRNPNSLKLSRTAWKKPGASSGSRPDVLITPSVVHVTHMSGKATNQDLSPCKGRLQRPFTGFCGYPATEVRMNVWMARSQ